MSRLVIRTGLPLFVALATALPAAPALAQFAGQGGPEAMRLRMRSESPEETLRRLQEPFDELESELAAQSLLAAARSSAGSARSDQVQATYDFLGEGIGVLESGNARRAIEDYFDPLLLVFEAMLAEQTMPTYVARSNKEGMYYILTAAGEGRNVQAIGSYGADVYYWKSEALRMLGDREGADMALERALELSPGHAWFVSESANRALADGELSAAIALFEESAELARLLSPPQNQTSELGAALRGRAYVLVESGRLEEALSQYRECLEIDPEDRSAAIEIAYLRQLIARRQD